MGNSLAQSKPSEVVDQSENSSTVENFVPSNNTKHLFIFIILTTIAIYTFYLYVCLH